MKQIFTLVLATALTTLSLNSFGQTCGIGGTFTAGTTNAFTTTSESFSGDFSWSSGGSGELTSTTAAVGQVKQLTTPTFYMPVTTSTLYWSFSLSGTMNVQTYSVQALYYVGAVLTAVPVCSGGSLTTVGSTLTFNAPTPEEILGKDFQLALTLNSTTNSSSKVLNIDNFRTNAINSSIPLPITLLSFQGSLSKNEAQLQWNVADNHTGDFFEVEKSNDGKNFSTAAVIATTQVQGNASYQYKESAQTSTYYRLKIVNKDRSVSYSKVLLMKAHTQGSSNAVTLLQNPVQQTLAFSFTSSTASVNEIAIYNLVGAKVHVEKMMVQKGNNTVTLKLANNLTSGTYILEVKNNLERTTTKFIKQ